MELQEGLARLNASSAAKAESELLKCCGSSSWARQLVARRPFADVEELITVAERIWWGLGKQDWLEAFSSHPKIGEKKAAHVQSSEAARWSEQEQAGTQAAAQEMLVELKTLNRIYEERFGFIFIVCATGKTTEEMLALIKERLLNDYTTELRIAAEEQRRITRLRLRKLLEQ